MQHLFKSFLGLIILICYSPRLLAQKPFAEGTIVYNVSIESADKKTQSAGTYTFVIKGTQMRKELRLNNGYNDIIIYNGTNNLLYSLESASGKKYAIQLSVKDMEKRQKKYEGFALEKKEGNKKIAGCNAHKAIITYKDGSTTGLYFTSEWYPVYEKMFDRLPGIKAMPLSFKYVDDKGMSMSFDAEKIINGPIENSDFRVPPDYKIITYNEYKQMNK